MRISFGAFLYYFQVHEKHFGKACTTPDTHSLEVVEKFIMRLFYQIFLLLPHIILCYECVIFISWENLRFRYTFSMSFFFMKSVSSMLRGTIRHNTYEWKIMQVSFVNFESFFFTFISHSLICSTKKICSTRLFENEHKFALIIIFICARTIFIIFVHDIKYESRLFSVFILF